MIHGMVELLTARRVWGWAYDVDDPRNPITVRVRLREKTLVQIRLEAPRPTHAAPFNENEATHAFCMEFSDPLRTPQLNNLTVEAMQPDSDSWHELPRPLWMRPAVEDLPSQEDKERIARSADRKVSQLYSGIWSNEVKNQIDFAESRPVFVLGPVRSGTSALCLALDKGTRYHGFAEGHLFDIAARLANSLNMHFELKELWMPSKALAGYQLGQVPYMQIQAELVEMLRRLAAGFTSPYWFDKTPTYQMIASVPTLSLAWPNARFIFMRRRGLENISSRMRKFPQNGFAEACKDWRIIMRGWRLARETVPEKFLEIDQHEMVSDPEGTSIRLGTLLGLGPEEVEAFADIIRRERPEVTGSAEKIFAGMDDLNWTTEQIETFREICGLEMEAYGYTYDERYSH